MIIILLYWCFTLSVRHWGCTNRNMYKCAIIMNVDIIRVIDAVYTARYCLRFPKLTDNIAILDNNIVTNAH